jgi:hypothetical protein
MWKMWKNKIKLLSEGNGIKLKEMEIVMNIYPEIDKSNANYDYELDKLFMKFLKKLIITRAK